MTQTLRAEPGDVIMTMGIGNVYLLCPEIVAEISGTGAQPDAGT